MLLVIKQTSIYYLYSITVALHAKLYTISEGFREAEAI